jgi:hypothetical protein
MGHAPFKRARRACTALCLSGGRNLTSRSYDAQSAKLHIAQGSALEAKIMRAGVPNLTETYK